MADNYARTEIGGIYTDEWRGTEASDLARRMIMSLRAVQHNRGFSRQGEDVLLLIGQWTEIGAVLRSPDYHRQIVRYWNMKPSLASGARKPSDDLIDKLQKLQVACDSVASHLRVVAFNAAEQAMRVFVYQYRMALSESERRAFDSRLMAQWSLRGPSENRGE